MKRKKIAESQLLIPKSYKEKQAKAARKRYKKTVIRVQFPDGVVLQGVFSPSEPTSALYEVSSCSPFFFPYLVICGFINSSAVICWFPPFIISTFKWLVAPLSKVSCWYKCIWVCNFYMLVMHYLYMMFILVHWKSCHRLDHKWLASWPCWPTLRCLLVWENKQTNKYMLELESELLTSIERKGSCQPSKSGMGKAVCIYRVNKVGPNR